MKSLQRVFEKVSQLLKCHSNILGGHIHIIMSSYTRILNVTERLAKKILENTKRKPNLVYTVGAKTVPDQFEFFWEVEPQHKLEQ